jgi:hypothetical protein
MISPEALKKIMQEQDVDVNTEPVVVVEEEMTVHNVGKYVGQCKWFNDLLGYGFVTVCDGNDKGKDLSLIHI